MHTFRIGLVVAVLALFAAAGSRSVAAERNDLEESVVSVNAVETVFRQDGKLAVESTGGAPGPEPGCEYSSSALGQVHDGEVLVVVVITKSADEIVTETKRRKDSENIDCGGGDIGQGLELIVDFGDQPHPDVDSLTEIIDVSTFTRVLVQERL